MLRKFHKIHIKKFILWYGVFLSKTERTMKIFSILSLAMLIGLTACQKRDTDTQKQDQTTTPHSVDKDS